MEENPNNMTSQETTSDRNFRRRTRYAQMSPERKQLLLSQLREKRAESKRQKNLHQSNSTAALTISTSSSVPQQAKRFQYESPGFCCDNGSIKLSSHNMPTDLRNFFLGDSKECQHFRTYSRAYNNMFAFTSLGVHYDRELAKRNHGIYTFRVQGQMYHFIDDLIPSTGKATNLQLYFYDNENELTNGMTLSANLNELIITKLMDMLTLNAYSTFLRSLIVVPNLFEFYIALNSSSNLDQRTYNLPTASKVGAIWIEDQLNDKIPTPHIRIYTHSNKTQLVNYYYGCYDPLQYPLLFSYGQNGWHCGIKKINNTYTSSKTTNTSEYDQLPSVKNITSIDRLLHIESTVLSKGLRERDTVSCREYYCYKFQIRDEEPNETLHSGRLFQQYIVDQYIKLETQRLDFVSFNQDLFRVEAFQGIIDLLRQGERDASNIGRQKFLPGSFIGGPRDMRRRYMDAIALVQHFGKPDIFLTMTCNPCWPEIQEHLHPMEEVQNKPDLVSRVFRAKVEELKTDIQKTNIFGKIAAFMYTIEFQKRGLPHAHFLIILTNRYKLLTPQSYDQIVCVELPDPHIDHHLYKLVTKHMIHGPCGNFNPSNSCMQKDGKCKFKYPKQLTEQTTNGKNSYPLYKRPKMITPIKVRGHNIDNSWTVPYNPFLLKKFGCHINVEICSDIKVIKYIYKYICKGHDKIAFSVHNNDTNVEIDEIK
ncbi:uncharacterized protein [Solanum tuberosum]|uniref:uncharacterized protein n=1 Tax=Solanum tuberosum TaxID=4113 RepID=UPI00073A2F3F|nr:PREDICTED: uncharacterized protein LOC107059069 [Solanum tuberosum]